MIYFVFVVTVLLSVYLGIGIGATRAVLASKKIFDRLPPKYAEAYLKEANKMLDEARSQ